jgi:acylphosphatase
MSERHVAHVIVHGEVQGVCFRACLQREAASAGVAGWCRNRFDGTVEALLCGPRAAVDRVVAWCRHGPPMARVTDLDITRDVPDPGDVGFRVRG